MTNTWHDLGHSKPSFDGLSGCTCTYVCEYVRACSPTHTYIHTYIHRRNFDENFWRKIVSRLGDSDFKILFHCTPCVLVRNVGECAQTSRKRGGCASNAYTYTHIHTHTRIYTYTKESAQAHSTCLIPVIHVTN